MKQTIRCLVINIGRKNRLEKTQYQELKVLIKPESIALSKEPVQNISLRNQVEGIMKEVFLKDGLAFCVVDVGENIIVEVTEASQKSMCLEKGQRVYCLFKSASLKIY